MLAKYKIESATENFMKEIKMKNKTKMVKKETKLRKFFFK